MQPKFLTKEERAALAIKKRQEEVDAKRKQQEEERKKQQEFLRQGKLNDNETSSVPVNHESPEDE